MNELSFGDEIGLIDWTLSNAQNALEYQNYILATYFKQYKDKINNKLIQGGKPSVLQTNIYKEYEYYYNNIINQIVSQIDKLTSIKQHIENNISNKEKTIYDTPNPLDDNEIDFINAKLQMELVDKEIEDLQLQLNKLEQIIKEK